jgi:hypothetical protein
MIRLVELKRLLISIAMIIALVVPPLSLASAQSVCRMNCAKEKHICQSCCAGDFSCGVSKEKSDAPRPLVAAQLATNWASSGHALLTRRVLLVLPPTPNLRPDQVAPEAGHPGDTLAVSCILLI